MPTRFDARTILIPLILLSGFLCFYALGRESLWFDEARSVIIARDGTLLWRSLLHDEGNMWLYYPLLHGWMSWGDSELVVRSLSALFGIAAIPAVYGLGAKHFGKAEGLMAAFLLSVNTFFVRYAQEARAYSLLLLLSVLASHFFLEALEKRSARRWIWYVLFSAAMIYTHLFGFLVLMAHGLSLFFRPKSTTPWKGLWLSAAGLFLLCLPLFLLSPWRAGCLDWVSPFRWDFLHHLLTSFAGGSEYLFSAYVLLFYFAWWGTAEKATADSPSRWPQIFLSVWFLSPIMATLLVSLLGKPVFVPRYLIISLPPFVMLGALGFCRVTEKPLKGLIGAVIVLLSSQSLHFYYITNTKEDWRGAAAHVLSKAQTGDPVVFFSYNMRQPFEYYLRRTSLPAERLQLVEIASQPYLSGDGTRLPDPDLTLLERLPKDHDRLWVVLSHNSYKNLGRDEQTKRILEFLERHYASKEEKGFRAIRVVLFEKKGPIPSKL